MKERLDGTIFLLWKVLEKNVFRYKRSSESCDMAGIQLDRIRYPRFLDADDNSHSLREYKLVYNKESQPQDIDFQNFKSHLTTSFVENANLIVKNINCR